MAVYLGSSAAQAVKKGADTGTPNFRGSAPGETTNILVANRFQIATNTASVPANFTSRRHHYSSAEGEIYDFHCVDSGLCLLSGVPTGGGARTIKRYIEYPESVFHQVTWAGATTKALATGAVDSDIVISSLTGQPLRIPQATKFWERTVNLNSTVAAFPRFELPATSVALGVDDGNDVADKGNSGTIAPTTTLYTFGMSALVGKIGKANAKAAVVYGDSITFGTGDITGVSARGSSGYVARLLDKYGYPYFKMAEGGWQASQAAVNTASPIALLDNIPAPIFLCQLGINDLRLNRTKAQIEADYQTIYGLPVAAGLSPSIGQHTITTRTDSSNGYADAAGQTTKTDGNMADLTPLNTDIRAGLPNVAFIVEAADADMTARNSNIHGGPFPPTTDGTHFTSPKADAMATAISI